MQIPGEEPRAPLLLFHHPRKESDLHVDDRGDPYALNAAKTLDRIEGIDGHEDLGPHAFEIDLQLCDGLSIVHLLRSEERRVGKECRSRWSPYH